MSAAQEPRNKVIISLDLVVKVQVTVWARREIRIASHRSEACRVGTHLSALSRHTAPALPSSRTRTF